MRLTSTNPRVQTLLRIHPQNTPDGVFSTCRNAAIRRSYATKKGKSGREAEAGRQGQPKVEQQGDRHAGPSAKEARPAITRLNSNGKAGNRAPHDRGLRGHSSPGTFRERGPPAIFTQTSAPAIPAHLSDQSHAELIQSFQGVERSPYRPLRPGYGKGKEVPVLTNFCAVKVTPPNGYIYDYAVEISPTPRNAAEREHIFRLLGASSEAKPFRDHIVNDGGGRLVSAVALPQPLDIAIPYRQDVKRPVKAEDKVFNLSITLTRELDPKLLDQYTIGHTGAKDSEMQPILSALNLIIQSHAKHEGFQVGPNRFFIPSKDEHPIGPNTEAVQGFYVAMRPSYNNMMVNVNTAANAFLKPGNVADAMLSRPSQKKGGMPTLPPEFIGKAVKTRHLGFRQRIHSVGSTSASKTFFHLEELKKDISVADYFKKQYPSFPLKHINNLPVLNVGNDKKPKWVPAEVCDIVPGQPVFDLKVDEQARLLKFTKHTPADNARSIVKKGLPTLGLNQKRPILKNFGVEISNELTCIPARELPPPTVTHDGGKFSVQNAGWIIKDAKFHKGAKVDRWCVVVVLDGKERTKGIQDPEVRRIAREFSQQLQESGMKMPPGDPQFVEIKLPEDRKEADREIEDQFKRLAKARGGKPTFTLVLLENQEDRHVYPAIKRLGDVRFGLPTVHIQLGTLLSKEWRAQYYSNIALKLNTKLGGINHKLDEKAMGWLRKQKTMMVGIDVTHPGLTSRTGSPSIASVVANVDDDFVQFPASINIQEGNREMVVDLKAMMIERLKAYQQKNKVLPERVLVFRDGVSEHQFDTVNTQEVPLILSAFETFSTADSTYRPTLSVIVCRKRHHSRFFPTALEHATSNGNTLPGTVIDKGITAVFDFDFYLQAHASIDSQVKLTHYNVIYDEISLGADEIQRGAHNASYLYARASKAVSLVPPAYYAHLACERARCYLHDFFSPGHPEKNKETGKQQNKETEVFGKAKDHWGRGLHERIKETMFYL